RTLGIACEDSPGRAIFVGRSDKQRSKLGILFRLSPKNYWKSISITATIAECGTAARAPSVPLSRNQPMQTTSLASPLREGQIFARQSIGNTMVLNPLIYLGSLHEPEIALETNELLDFLNRSTIANLVIDLAQGDYLGTSMLGAIVKLW